MSAQKNWRKAAFMQQTTSVCIDERLSFEGGSVMDWAWITSQAGIELDFTRVTLWQLIGTLIQS